MPGEEQERFEDYLELDRYLEELEAGKTPRLPAGLTPEQARIFRMAALFRSSAPGAEEPRPEFAADLEARLLQARHSPPPISGKLAPLARVKNGGKPGFLSRRALLAGGSAIAASLAAGAAIEYAVEQAASPAQHAPPANQTGWGGVPLVPADVPSQWILVTALADLGDQAVRFSVSGIVGYVLRLSGGSTGWKNSGQEQVIALSAACTHMGCIVQWQADRQFHCPCHGGLFAADGSPAAGASGKLYLRPLPTLDTKIEQGNIYVRVPAQS